MARIPLEVNNRALGGMPEMPYSWCAKEFIGDDADVVTWEFGMMEGSKWEEVEDFIRHTLSLPHQPAILLMPNSATSQRFDVLQHYSRRGGFVQQWAMDWPAMLAKLIGSGVPLHDEAKAPDLLYVISTHRVPLPYTSALSLTLLPFDFDFVAVSPALSSCPL